MSLFSAFECVKSTFWLETELLQSYSRQHLRLWSLWSLWSCEHVLLTLLALHSSVVSRLSEIDVPQVQDPGHDLQHHGSVLGRDANDVHGVLGKNKRKRSC